MRLVAVLLLSGSLSFSQNSGDLRRELTFSDEFDGSALDLAKWSPHDPLVKAGERESKSKFEVSGGKFEVSGGMLRADGVMSTFGTFSQAFGRYEIRCRVTEGKFRLLPLALGPLPAIDIFVAPPTHPTSYSFANHWGTEQTERSYGDSFPVPAPGFHIIAMEWQPDHIAWFVDGKEQFRSGEGIPNQAMFLWLELKGEVDYIRVYRK